MLRRENNTRHAVEAQKYLRYGFESIGVVEESKVDLEGYGWRVEERAEDWAERRDVYEQTSD